jgi:diaminopimelate decarboxylase
VNGFTREGGVLCCDGVPLPELAAEHGTPLYVYSQAELLASLAAYEEAFAPLPHRICYALKANSTLALLRVLASRGAGADIVSGFELQAALRAGFPASRIVFSGVGKTQAEMESGLRAGIAAFNAESEEEVVRLSRVATALATTARVALRANPDVDARSHPYISTGLARNKFGLDIAETLAVAERVRELPAVRLLGLSCHIGSQMTDLAPVAAAVSSLVEVTRELQRRGFELQTIDIGGGLGIDYRGDGSTPTPQQLAERVLPLLSGLGLPVLLEPGRSLVGRAGVLVTRVLYVKDRPTRRFVIVDAGMNDLLRPALYDAYHRIEPAVPRGGSLGAVDVVGPVCETGDFLARDREMEPSEPGDLLVIRDAGAYGAAMASNYNMRPRPAEVLVAHGVPRRVRRRETVDDLLRLEE